MLKPDKFRVIVNTFLKRGRVGIMQPRWYRDVKDGTLSSGQDLLDTLKQDHDTARQIRKTDHISHFFNLSLVSAVSIRASFIAQGLNDVDYGRWIDIHSARANPCASFSSPENVCTVSFKTLHDGFATRSLTHTVQSENVLRLLKGKAANDLCSVDFLQAVRDTVPSTSVATLKTSDTAIELAQS